MIEGPGSVHEGSLTWNYQREAAGQAIRALKGVVGVSNLITLEKLNVSGSGASLCAVLDGKSIDTGINGRRLQRQHVVGQ